jgi:hypothetical protein
MFDQMMSTAGLYSEMVPMDGQRVFASAQAGEELRTELFRVLTDVAGGSLHANEDLDDKAVARLNVAIERRILGSDVGIGLDGLTVVEGTGVYLAGEDTGEAYYTPTVLTSDERIFGKLAGVAFNSYPFVPGIDLLPPDFEGDVEVHIRDGLVMVLASVMVCATEGYGPRQSKHNYALVPLPEQSLRILGGEVLG